jgi:hypothetical protein
MLSTYPDHVQPDAEFIPAASRALHTLPRPMFSAVAMSVTERPALKSFTASSAFSRAEGLGMSCYSVAEEITSVCADFLVERRGFEPVTLRGAGIGARLRVAPLPTAHGVFCTCEVAARTPDDGAR